jgi:hypothetical protein
VSGGFRRKLDAEQVILYRNDWFVLVARERAANPSRLPDTNPASDSIELELATSIAEIYREREEYELLALHYMEVGNNELRDKYIELAIDQGIEDEALIFFRAAQGQLDLVPKEVIGRRIKELEDANSFFSLGRLYRETGQYEAAVQATCEGAQFAIEEGNVFTAAFHLKEMIEEGTLQELFMIAMEQARKKKDLWWQYRALQELEWYAEGNEFLLKHRKEIEKAGEPHFLEVLAVALGDNDTYIELRKQEAQSISAKPEPDNNNE